MSRRDDIMAQAQSRSRLRYRLDPVPDGVTTTDCSLLVRDSVRAAGAGELPRTAEQQRQATIPIPWQQAKPGDLVFFENTYGAAGPAGPDGKIASHVGFSLGAGTQRMLDARERDGADVGITDISSDYWQDRFIEVRRLPALMDAEPAPAPGGALSLEPEHRFTFAELYPTIHAAAQEYGADERVMAGILNQESGFRNYRVHHDQTGHGLIGLDDNGMLPDFEHWSGTSVGRGASAAIIAPELQIRYLAYQLKRYANLYGDFYAAARAWHRGGGAMNDARGQNYESLIREHIADLFAEGPPAIPTPEPGPTPATDKDAIIAQLEAALAAEREKSGGLITALAVLGDDVGDAMQAEVDKLRAIREQFVGSRPSA